MSNKTKFSRRDFVKSTTIASSVLLGSATIHACSSPSEELQNLHDPFPYVNIKNFNAQEGLAGLLFSQVGYETGLPVRVIVRLPEKELLPTGAICRLTSMNNENTLQGACHYWGALWGSHWWVATFPIIESEDEWMVEILAGKNTVMRDSGLKTGKNILWDATVPYASVDMLERRVHFTKVGAGWQDAGTLWVESPAQSAMIISLQDMLEQSKDRLDASFIERIYTQIIVGCDYLVMTQDKAVALGHAPGAMSHDLLGHENFILPNDVVKAVVALFRAARLLPESYQDKKESYAKAGELSLWWLLQKAKPLGDVGLNRRQRGLAQDTPIPDDEWMTRELVFFCWSGLEYWKLGNDEGKEICLRYAAEINERQISKDHAENGFYGHFREFASLPHSENAWIHAIEHTMYGADAGGLYPNYLMPLIEMLKLWPDHRDAGQWKKTLESFAYGYLKPACHQNPFYLMPNGIFDKEGPIWFAGPFHGSNTVYGYTAALALELSSLFEDEDLKHIAYGNLQWMAGLNAGLTRDSLKESVVFSMDVPEGVALPISMICNIGRRWGGTWFNTRGVICNGFSAGKQFRMDLDPTKENDAPSSFTDEDWIPHSAGWLTGLNRL